MVIYHTVTQYSNSTNWFLFLCTPFRVRKASIRTWDYLARWKPTKILSIARLRAQMSASEKIKRRNKGSSMSTWRHPTAWWTPLGNSVRSIDSRCATCSSSRAHLRKNLRWRIPQRAPSFKMVYQTRNGQACPAREIAHVSSDISLRSTQLIQRETLRRATMGFLCLWKSKRRLDKRRSKRALTQLSNK